MAIQSSHGPLDIGSPQTSRAGEQKGSDQLFEALFKREGHLPLVLTSRSGTRPKAGGGHEVTDPLEGGSDQAYLLQRNPLNILNACYTPSDAAMRSNSTSISE